jgi:hypothetical protein
MISRLQKDEAPLRQSLATLRTLLGLPGREPLTDNAPRVGAC